MSAPDVLVHAIRVGVFSSLGPADRSVSRLLQAGFTPEQVTVVCAGEVKENYFRKLKESKQKQAGGEAGSGAAIGATVGGLSAVALGVATGAVPLVVAGIAGAAGGSAMGGFVGVMTSKEVENDFLNSCHEQVLAGKILVAVQEQSENEEVQARLAQAVRIFNEEGSETNALPQP